MPKGAANSAAAIAAVPRNVSRAIVIKNHDVFFLSEHDASVPPGNQDGFGLYYHDCRYLDGYEILLAGSQANPLIATADRGSIAEFELTNNKLKLKEGEVAAQKFGIRLQRVIDGRQLAIHDVLKITNYDVHGHKLPLTFRLQSQFEDVFVIRGIQAKKVGAASHPEWKNGVLVLSYDGADGVNRRVEAHFDPKPQKTSDGEAEYELHIGAGEQQQISVSLFLVESKQQKAVGSRRDSDAHSAAGHIDHASGEWLAKYAEVHSDSPLLNDVMRRCLLDLLVLRSELDDWQYISAGLPWYGALFGRDSVIAALETLPYEPNIAEQTLHLLAKYQGKESNDWRDEQPGKILHELRRGELANLNEIPQTPYYGSVDSTPLFLILLGQHARWTGRLDAFRDLEKNVGRALEWIDKYGTDPDTGYLSYATKSKKGLGNQGWKDSGDSIMNADGSLAEPPIALVEVQGYVYYAKVLMAELYERSGDAKRAARLRDEADDLKKRFNRDFWVDEKQFYAIALQKDKKPAAVISSNPGQALWTGIVDEERAEPVVHGLMAPNMFGGWGVRTLSNDERRANPVGYHLGTVWPHDNSIIAAGLRRYGFDQEALQVFDGILHAARNFPHYRLPEVFAGFSRNEISVPVRYPVACHPQAWAAGSVPFFLTTLLGLAPDGFNQRLELVNPVLPKEVNELEFRRVKVGKGAVSLKFRRDGDGVDVEITQRDGDVSVALLSQDEDAAA